MKHFLFSTAFMLFTVLLNAQQDPDVSGNGINSNNFWSRSGNNQTNGNNIFGTRWNSPIYFITGGLTQQTYRMKLNGDFAANVPQYGINGFTAGVNTSGYLGLGYNLQGIWSQNPSPAGAAKGPFSLLHLNGRDGTAVQEFGYRPWMKTGITFTDNNDLSYIGLRKLGDGTDDTETTITWADNQNNNNGPDDMCFRFTGGNGNSISTNLNSATDLDGLHVARFTGFGHFGLGNTFGNNAGAPGLYVRPQSLLHLSHTWNAQEREWGFMQITYRNQTNETENDGLRLGIDRQFNTFNGYLRWQENTPFIVQTDWNNTAGGIRNGERMRIASINAPGVPDPLNAPSNNVTRVAISHLGNDPITSPRSLLHLGYDTGTALLPLNDGWRNWMDVGTFTNRASDNMYVGLKEEGTDRFDAVINWGDNQVPGASPNGPDFLRFIFTSTTTALTGQGDPISQSNEGLEVTRMDPQQASTLTDNFGMVGIGNYAVNGPNTAAADVIDAKLDIDGDLRIREVTQDNSLTQVLVIDPSDHNRVHYADINIPNAGNGFIACADTTDAANLLTDSKVNLNDNQLYFENNNTFGQNHTGFGYDCGSVLPAKVSVEQVHPTTVPDNSTAISGINSDVTTGFLKTYTGVYGQATELQNINLRPTMIGGDFTAANGALNFGVRSSITNSPQANESNFGFYSMIDDNNSAINYGSYNVASNSNLNVGVHGQANALLTNPTTLGYGGRFISWSHDFQNVGVEGNTSSVSAYGFQNFGVAGVAGSATNNYAIYGEAQTNSPGTNFYAGYFTGNVVFTGGAVLVSDSTYKENIAPLDDVADSLLMLIEPYSYEYQQTGNAERLRLDSGTKFGVMAQQIEPYFPHMVKEVTHPAEVDSVGNIVNPSFQYKAVDITQLIPVMLYDTQKKNETIEEQSNTIAELDSTVTDLNERLTQLENCLSGILPFLCQLSNTAIEENDMDVQNELIKTIHVELSNKDNIVLNQNVPNPFAESTVITYSIPESVQKAQIHFYDGTGKLINSADIEERGAGRLNVFGSDLSRGVYTYSLVADGQVVSTKRMMKQ